MSAAFRSRNYTTVNFGIFVRNGVYIANLLFRLPVMLQRRLFLTSKYLFNKEILNFLSSPYEKPILYIGLNARSLTGGGPRRNCVCFLPYLSSERTILKPFDERRCLFKRFYSGDPSVTFVSGGKSMNFENNATHDARDLLAMVIGQLKDDNGVNISVIETSEERKKYADYVIVVSGRTTRHLKAMTNHLHHKAKKDFPQKQFFVTGLDSDDWMIVDFGLIVIHLFLPETREVYELEKLWSLGPEHDKQYQEMLKDDEYAEMVKNAKLQDFFVNRHSRE